MTTTPFQPPATPPAADPGSVPTAAIPIQRTGSPVPPPAPPVGKGRRRWPWAVGGLVLGLLLGASVHGGAAAPAPTANAGAPVSAAPAPLPSPQTVYVTVPPAAPEVAAAPPAPAAPAGPLTTFSDGTYEVGADIAAGKYKTPGPGSTDIMDSCYMEVGDGSGNIGGIDKNDNLTGPGVVTLKKGKVFTVKGGCTWSKVG